MGQEQVKPQTIHPFWSPWAQGHTTPSCSVGGAGSLAQQSPPPCEISMVRLITCRNSQLHGRVRHEIAHRTLVSEVVLLNLHWGRSSMWAPSPMLFSLPTMFSLHRQYDKTPKISSFKRSVYLAHSFSHVCSRVLDPVAWSWGRSQHGRGELPISWQLWSRASRKDLGSGTP